MEHAYTAPNGMFPPYVNVKVMDDGWVQVIVRSPPQDEKCGTAGMIALPRDVFERVFGPVVDEVRYNDVIDT